MNTLEIQRLKEVAREVRQLSLRMVFDKKASHIGGAFSIADILAVLYGKYILPNSGNRLFYSKGHACTALYSSLAIAGYFPREDLQKFAVNGCLFTSHTNHKIPGVEISAGSLGHVLPVATGLAYSRRKGAERIFCVISDGELNEGSNWEAILFAGHHRLSRLCLVIDYNKIQSFGFTKDILDLDPLADKFKAFGWQVQEIDGHDIGQGIGAFEIKTDRPLAVIAHTIKGKGVSFMEGNLLWHYRSPSQAEFDTAWKELSS